ncbi:MAG: hypothetical protein ACLS64_01460 [Eubacterium sp.]
MELDIIILPKSGNEIQSQVILKQELVKIFEKIYDDVQNGTLQITINSEKVNVNYRISAKSDNMLFLKLWCKYTPVKEAEILDNAVNRLIRGEHRKDWNIVIIYDEVSQLYCCKLMPLFGVFERRTRELVYTTIIKIFGIKWFEKSFSENLQNTLKSKGNKTQLIEGALNELTYEQLKEYLFVPYSNSNFEDMLDKEFAKENLGKLSKEEITNMIEKCRKVSLWERFFGEYEQFKDFENKIEYLQPHRNTVMHNKRMTKGGYEEIRKQLKSINKLLSEAISVIEDEMYTDTKLIDVVAAFGNMCAKILGRSIPNWMEKVKPALASLGRIVIESAMPKINIPVIMPEINLGADLAKRFEQVYKVPQLEIPSIHGMQSAFASINSENISAINAVYNNVGLNRISQIAEQANKLSTFHNVSTFNYPEMQELKKIADRYNHISNDLETVIDDGAKNQYHEDENETIYDKKEDKDTK